MNSDHGGGLKSTAVAGTVAATIRSRYVAFLCRVFVASSCREFLRNVENKGYFFEMRQESDRSLSFSCKLLFFNELQWLGD